MGHREALGRAPLPPPSLRGGAHEQDEANGLGRRCCTDHRRGRGAHGLRAGSGQHQPAAQGGHRQRDPAPRARPAGDRQRQPRHPRSGTAGFDESADYVDRQLVQAGYNVSEQTFDFPFFQETAPAAFNRVSPDPRTFTGREFATMTYSGSGDVTAQLQEVDVTVPAGTRRRARRTRLRAGRLRGLHRGQRRADPARHRDFRVKAPTRRPPARRPPSSSTRASPAAPTRSPARSARRTSDIPVIGTSSRSAGAAPTQTRAGAVTVHVKTQTISETRRRPRTSSPTRRGGDPSRSIVHRLAPRLRARRARASTTTAPARPRPRVGDPGRQARHQAEQHDALRLVGRRGGQPARLDALRRQPARSEVTRRSTRTSTST